MGSTTTTTTTTAAGDGAPMNVLEVTTKTNKQAG